MKTTISQSLCAASAELDAAQKALTEVLTVIERARAFGVAVSPQLLEASTALAEEYATACAAYRREFDAHSKRPTRPVKRWSESFASTGDALLALT